MIRDRIIDRLRMGSSSRRGLATASTASIPPTYTTLPRHNRASDTSTSGSLPDFQVDHLIVGGGVVGLAIAHALARRFPHRSTYLVERHKRPGQETSSRNSEVIHAGLFYAPDSLKTNLCLRGRELLYDFCQQHGVPFRQTGKLVVGTESSHAYLQGVVDHVTALDKPQLDNIGALIAGPRHAPPLRIIEGDEARSLEPNLGAEVGWTLDSPRTGIVDSHELMATLERLTLEHDAAEIVYDTSVVGIRPAPATASSGTSKRGGDGSTTGWIVEAQTEGGEVDQLLARHVINASGLNGPAMLNALVRDGHLASQTNNCSMIGTYYSKGNYATYSKAKGGVDQVRRLLYPLPDMGSSKDKHGHQGLGTHLTLDLDGNIKFGPDTDWLDPSRQSQTGHTDAFPADWWADHLVALQPSWATLNQAHEEERLDAMFASVTSFLPHIQRHGLQPDYAGIRPKLVGPGGGFVDFTIYHHSVNDLAHQAVQQEAFSMDHLASTAKRATRQAARQALFAGQTQGAQPSLVTLCGIESPGLTSSLALAEVVCNLIARRGWDERIDAEGPLTKGAENDHAGLVHEWA